MKVLRTEELKCENCGCGTNISPIALVLWESIFASQACLIFFFYKLAVTELPVDFGVDQ